MRRTINPFENKMHLSYSATDRMIPIYPGAPFFSDILSLAREEEMHVLIFILINYIISYISSLIIICFVKLF